MSESRRICSKPSAATLRVAESGHRVQPFPAHSLRGDDHRARFDQMDVPRQRVAVVLIACAGQGDPERGVDEKKRDSDYLRLAVP